MAGGQLSRGDTGSGDQVAQVVGCPIELVPGAEASAEAGVHVEAGRGVPAQVAGVRGWLGSVDVEALSDRERVDLVAELERLKGAACAAQARATDHLRCSREQTAPRDAARSVGSEVALARRESPSLGDRFVGVSRALVHEMPSTMRALTAGVIGERHAVVVVQATSTLSLADRAEVDRRVGPLLGRLGAGAAGRAARRVAAELDAASVVRRMEAAARSRRVTVRPAPDGMAYLCVLAPLRETVGAYAALRARAAAVVAGQCPEEGPDGRGVGAVMADTATRLMSGRAAGQVQPLEVHLVMTDTALLGPDAGSRARGGPGSRPADGPTSTTPPGVSGSVMEPARIPGHGSVPAPVARAWIREADEGSVWLRRLYTGPDGRDLVAMDSRRRAFTGLLRRLLVLRDDVCATPWCDGVIAHADHTRPVRQGGPTDLANGGGRCARCNYVKEAPGWRVRVTRPGPARQLQVDTPLGRRHTSTPPPLLGWGWQPHTHPRDPADATGRHAAERPDPHPDPVAGHARPGAAAPAGGPDAVRPFTAPDIGAAEACSARGRPDVGTALGRPPILALLEPGVEPHDDPTGSVLERYLAGLLPAA